MMRILAISSFMGRKRLHSVENGSINILLSKNILAGYSVEIHSFSEKIIQRLVKEEMEGAMALSVPLTVAVGVGKNWREAH